MPGCYLFHYLEKRVASFRGPLSPRVLAKVWWSFLSLEPLTPSSSLSSSLVSRQTPAPPRLEVGRRTVTGQAHPASHVMRAFLARPEHTVPLTKRNFDELRFKSGFSKFELEFFRRFLRDDDDNCGSGRLAVGEVAEAPRKMATRPLAASTLLPPLRFCSPLKTPPPSPPPHLRRLQTLTRALASSSSAMASPPAKKASVPPSRSRVFGFLVPPPLRI